MGAKLEFPVTPRIRLELEKAGIRHIWDKIDVHEDSYDELRALIENGGYGHLTPDERHAIAVGCCYTHPDHKDKHLEPLRHPIKKASRRFAEYLAESIEWKIYSMILFRIVVIVLLALVLATSAKCQDVPSQITVIRFTDSGNTQIKGFVAPFTIKCGASMTCTASGSILTMQSNATGTVTSFSSGNLPPLFTTSVSNATTTPALSFSLSNAGANTVFGNNTGSSAAPSFFSFIAPITKAAVASKWLNSFDSTTGLFTNSQPACADLSNAAASCSTDATNASNISSGTLPAGRMPALTGDVTSSAGSVATTLAASISGTHTFTGSLNGCTLNGMPIASSGCFTTLASCYAAIPSTGGTCIVVPNYSETMAASLTMNVNYAGFMFMGPASIVMGSNQVIISAGTYGAFIKGMIPFGSAVLVAGSGVEFNYTGSSTAFNLGSSSANSVKLIVENINIFLNNAGTSAIGMTINRYADCELNNIDIIGPGGSITQIGIKMDGTGNFVACRVNNAHIENVQTGIQCTGSGVNACNGTVINGGTINVGATNSVGLDFRAQGTGNTVFGTDLENMTTALNFADSAGFNFIVYRGEVNTTDEAFSSTACSNWVFDMTSATPTVTDPTLCNTVIDPKSFRIDSTGVMAPRTAGGLTVGTVGAPYGGMIVGPTGNQTMKLSATSSTNNTALIGKLVVGSSEFTTAANTNLQTITGLSWVMPANTALTVNFQCEFLYSQATATAAVSFGIQSATIAPTNIMAKGQINTTATAATWGNLPTLSTTTATAVVTATPSAITTIWNASMYGTVENPSNASTNTINIMVKTATSGDAVTIKRGSFCKIL